MCRGCWCFPGDAEPALPLPCSSTGRSSIPRIASPGLSLGELSQQVPALTLTFPRGIKGKERGKVLTWKKEDPGGRESHSKAFCPRSQETLCLQHNCQVTIIPLQIWVFSCDSPRAWEEEQLRLSKLLLFTSPVCWFLLLPTGGSLCLLVAGAARLLLSQEWF